jgi:hypothetical protein
MMPEVMRFQGDRFFFFRREGNEPCPIHVEKAEGLAKFWLAPVALAEARGFRPPEVRALHNLVEAHQEAFTLAWYEHFGR